jgi:hypothetical protein
MLCHVVAAQGFTTAGMFDQVRQPGLDAMA